jgi:hypothetical protein
MLWTRLRSDCKTYPVGNRNIHLRLAIYRDSICRGARGDPEDLRMRISFVLVGDGDFVGYSVKNVMVKITE